MKKTILPFLLWGILATVSCSKSDENTGPTESKNEVTINGSNYTTVSIGKQTWTSVNYNGSGGVNYNDGANDPTLGKLYSYPEVKAISNLPTGWRLPTKEDVQALMTYVGTKVDGSETYTDVEASKKMMSTTGWSNTTLSGNNAIGFNLMPTGYLFISPTLKSYNDKGVLASFWTSTTLVSPSTISSGIVTAYVYYPLIFELSTNTTGEGDKLVGLRGLITNTSADGDGNTARPAEKRSIRFVKDN